ncbi:MAG TPA: hypothetical protein VN934_08855 [Candidatus Tumulicola sp.]|nr:hypothetical protein [Candidatus Tumulicola sp.]
MITVTLDDVRATLTMRADGWMHGARVAYYVAGKVAHTTLDEDGYVNQSRFQLIRVRGEKYPLLLVTVQMEGRDTTERPIGFRYVGAPALQRLDPEEVRDDTNSGDKLVRRFNVADAQRVYRWGQTSGIPVRGSSYLSYWYVRASSGAPLLIVTEKATPRLELSLGGICFTEMKYSDDPFRYLVLCK